MFHGVKEKWKEEEEKKKNQSNVYMKKGKDVKKIKRWNKREKVQ